MKDHLKKQPTKTEWMIEQLASQLQSDLQNIAMQVMTIARALKLTPEDFVKALKETGANHAYVQNCQLVEKHMQEEKIEREAKVSEEAKEAIDKVAIK